MYSLLCISISMAVVFCGGSAVHGRVSKDCMLFSNSIIVIRTCTVEAIDIGQLVPCELKLVMHTQ